MDFWIYFIIGITAFGAAVLTFFSGFGLGTILTPVFILFFPVDVAIALTGIVHFCNNLFKLILVGKGVDWTTAIRFGIPSVIAAFIGAWVLLQISSENVLFEYEWIGKLIKVTTIQFVIGLLLLFFALMDIIPRLKNIQFEKDKLVLGGLLSGFFGGLSGHQGALRSAFLIKSGLSKEAFIGTAVVVSTGVDMARLSIYSNRLLSLDILEQLPLILTAVVCAFTGAFLGKVLLKKITIDALQTMVGVFLVVLSILLMIGLI